METPDALYSIIKTEKQGTVNLEINILPNTTIPQEFYSDIQYLLSAYLSTKPIDKLKHLQEFSDVITYRIRANISPLMLTNNSAT